MGILVIRIHFLFHFLLSVYAQDKQDSK